MSQIRSLSQSCGRGIAESLRCRCAENSPALTCSLQARESSLTTTGPIPRCVLGHSFWEYHCEVASNIFTGDWRFVGRIVGEADRRS